MSEEHSDSSLSLNDDLADLHKIAASNGEGFVPDMHEIIGERERRSRAAREKTNILLFPHLRARHPGDDIPIDLGADAENGGEVSLVKAVERYSCNIGVLSWLRF
ncbi:hypothetical protein [Agrobacterium sp. Azo12]|uniref:hypothetical protein n=1 Tax=Agrobacterium sp. Azo12 TaxID=3031129 RepID=UPI0023D82AE6|nr:hypothetical protein [Agrobacterium sp. Azo12]MDO5896564.1 hypothetical protein [Agrobacterium sp. Azo12]